MELKEETLLEQMTRVRPEVLDENALKLFNKIMEVIDERDDLQQRLAVVNEMNVANYNKYFEALEENKRLKEEYVLLQNASDEYEDELQQRIDKILTYAKDRCDDYLKEDDCEYCDGVFASCRKVLQLAGEDISEYK